MTQKYKLFYTRESERGVCSVDCEVEREGNPEVYRVVDDDKLSAVRVNEKKSKVLTEDGGVEEATVQFIREMDAPYEQYIYGGTASTTKTHVKFSGEHHGRTQLANYKSSVNIRVGATVAVKGTADCTTSEWEWEILNTGSSEYVRKDEEMTEFFGKTCLAIGFNEPLDTVEVVRPIFETEEESWIER